MNLTNPAIPEQQRNIFSYFCSGKANNKNNNMKKRNHILAAAGKLLVALVTVGTLFPACAELETPTPDPKPRNLVIEEFRYDGIPAEGGSVKPVISYSYQVLEEGRYVKKTDGAVLTFSVSEPLILDDDGTVTAPRNTSGKTITHQVKLTARVNSLKTEKTVGIPQYPQEGVKSVEYTLVPLELGPHEAILWTDFLHMEERTTFISNSKDGCYTETISRPCPDGNGIEYLVLEGQTETVPCTGTQIPFTGGDLLTTITYYDGKVETEVEKAVFSVESSFPDATDTLKYTLAYLIETIPATLPPESIVGATVADGVWTINKIVSPFTRRGVHKLIATTSRGSQSITLNQDENKLMREDYAGTDDEIYYEFNDEIGKDANPFCSRIYWPDFENYPPGSDPKWAHAKSGWWWPLCDTRSLHPDSNRYIVVSTDEIYAKKWHINTLRSGDEFWWVGAPRRSVRYTDEGFVMTAEADIPTAEGIKHKELRYEFQSPDDYYIYMAFSILIPDYPEAIDTFEWTVTFKYPGPECNVMGLLEDGRPASNWKEVAHLCKDAVYTFKNCKDLAQDWVDSYAPWGFYDAPLASDYGLAPYIVLEDGVEIAWDKLIEGYFYSNPKQSRDLNEIPREE